MKIAVVCSVLALSLSVFAQEPNALFREVRPDLAATLEPAALSLDAETVRRRYVELNAAALTSGRPVALNLFDDAGLTIDPSKIRRLEDGTWQLADRQPSETWTEVTMGISGGTVHGTIHLDRKAYEIRSITAGTVAIEEIDVTQPLAPDVSPERGEPASPFAPPDAGERRSAPRSIAPNIWEPPPPNLTLLVLNPYLTTPCLFPGQLSSQQTNFQANLNHAFSFDSKSLATATVISKCVFYTASGDMDVDLEWVKSNATVAGLRSQYRADIVTLLVPNGETVSNGTRAGLAPGTWGRTNAFNVVAAPYATSTWTLAHEIGHNLGMRHDRATENDWTSTDCNFGYCRNDGPRDIMSYDSACTGTYAAGLFSTPRTYTISFVTFGPFGVGCSTLASNNTYTRADNQRTLIRNAPIAAAWY